MWQSELIKHEIPRQLGKPHEHKNSLVLTFQRMIRIKEHEIALEIDMNFDFPSSTDSKGRTKKLFHPSRCFANHKINLRDFRSTIARERGLTLMISCCLQHDFFLLHFGYTRTSCSNLKSPSKEEFDKSN